MVCSNSALADARRHAGSPRLPDPAEVRFALLRRRRRARLQLTEHEVQIAWEEGTRRMVEIRALDQDGYTLDHLGYAYLDGGGRRELADALRSAEPPEPRPDAAEVA